MKNLTPLMNLDKLVINFMIYRKYLIKNCILMIQNLNLLYKICFKNAMIHWNYTILLN